MDPHSLDLRRSIRDPLIGDNIIKVNILVAKIFPKTRIADFNNIAIKAIRDQRVFNISPSILMEKVNKLIKSLLNKKVLGLDSILNKVFKIIALVIAKSLIKVASYCLTNRIILKRLKKSITIVLYKEAKKNHFFLNSYRLIAFKNILIKVVKKHIANIISKATEEYKLLP